MGFTVYLLSQYGGRLEIELIRKDIHFSSAAENSLRTASSLHQLAFQRSHRSEG